MKRRIPAVLALVLLATGLSAEGRTQGMPLCQSDQPAPRSEPKGTPSLNSPGACRAKVTAMQRVDATPAPGYHHLGATTATRWSGVIGRVEITDAEVRPDTYDFVATRFMAKAQTQDGTAWLEAGWTETGWNGIGRQRIYTYDTNRQSWVFYDEYQIKPGDRVWIYLHTEQEGDRPAWQAWLWWGERWNLLTRQELPIGSRALIEQYVEVHGDKPVRVPPVGVDSVALQDGPQGPRNYWDGDTPTSPGAGADGYCLNWIVKYSAWTAGTCG